MLRAVSTRNGKGYEKLREEHESGALLEAKLTRAKTVPAKVFSPTKQSEPAQSSEAKAVEKKAKKVSKIHPIFNLFHRRLRQKATAKPEFSRYLEYLKEGGARISLFAFYVALSSIFLLLLVLFAGGYPASG